MEKTIRTICINYTKSYPSKPIKVLKFFKFFSQCLYALAVIEKDSMQSGSGKWLKTYRIYKIQGAGEGETKVARPGRKCYDKWCRLLFALPACWQILKIVFSLHTGWGEEKSVRPRRSQTFGLNQLQFAALLPPGDNNSLT